MLQNLIDLLKAEEEGLVTRQKLVRVQCRDGITEGWGEHAEAIYQQKEAL